MCPTEEVGQQQWETVHGEADTGEREILVVILILVLEILVVILVRDMATGQAAGGRDTKLTLI